jgi:hypothetical protein
MDPGRSSRAAIEKRASERERVTIRLDAIPVDPTELAALPAHERRALALRCVATLGALLVDANQAISLGMSAKTLRNRGRRHPAYVDNGTRKQAYSVKRIQRMIASR